MSTRPKNCRPAEGGRFWPCSAVGAFTNFSSGPKVGSRSPGPKVPAWSGPETNSQNGVKSWNCGLVGVVVVRGRVVHVGGQPDRVVDAGGLDEAQQVGDLELAAAGRRPAGRWRRPRRPSCSCQSFQTMMPSGMSEAMTFQVARELASSRFSQLHLLARRGCATVSSARFRHRRRSAPR